jgi:hypothetical protein
MNSHTKQKIGTEDAVELARLLRAVTVRAEHVGEGHFTLSVFTTCVKFAFGTIEDWRELEMAVKLPSFKSLGDALRYALSSNAMVDYEQIRVTTYLTHPKSALAKPCVFLVGVR